MTPIRTGVAGVGHLGYHHARLYADLGEAELVGVADPDEARAAEVAQTFSCQAFHDAEALIDAGVQAVSVAAPTTVHASLTHRLLEAGVDVLVEKPIASAVREADAMVAAAAQYERILQVGHVERFNGAVEALLRAIKQPQFIECHRLSPYPARGHDVSVVHDLMIHDLEIVGALVPGEISHVDAVGIPVFSSTEDIANVRLRFDTGCVANLTCSRISLERMRKIRIFEPDAYVSTNYSEQEVVVYRKKPGAPPPGANPMELITMETLEVDREEPLKKEIEAFLASVRTRRSPVVNGAQATEALRLAQDIVSRIREQA